MSDFKFKLNGVLFSSDKVSTGEEFLKIAGLEPVNDFELLLKINHGEWEPIQLDESVDLSTPGIEGFYARPYKTIKVLVDDEPVEFKECFVTPKQILEAVQKTVSGYYLKQIRGHRQITYKNDPDHSVSLRNGLRFTTCKKEPTTVSNNRSHENS